MAATAAISGGSHSKTMATPTACVCIHLQRNESKTMRSPWWLNGEFERFAEAAAAVSGKSIEMRREPTQDISPRLPSYDCIDFSHTCIQHVGRYS